MAADCAYELREHHVTMVSLWPGAVRTEAIVDMLQDSEKVINLFIKNSIVRDISPKYLGGLGHYMH